MCFHKFGEILSQYFQVLLLLYPVTPTPLRPPSARIFVDPFLRVHTFIILFFLRYLFCLLVLHSGYILNNVPSVLLDVHKQAELFQGCSGWHFIRTSIGSASFGLLIILFVIPYIQLFLGWMKVMENYNCYWSLIGCYHSTERAHFYIWPVTQY